MKLNLDQEITSKTQYPFNYTSKNTSEPSNTVLFNWDGFSKRPLTINSNKPRSNFQGTYYGGFKDTVKGNPMLSSLYLPKSKKKNVKYSELEIPTTTGIKSNIKFPAELYGNMSKGQFAGGSPTNYGTMHFRTNTTEITRPFKTRPILPILQATTKTKKKPEFRPCTGNSEWKDLMADKEAEVIGRIGTAQKPSKGQRWARISTPQTTTQKRPDSRYNKETLYAKLDYGRANSPEYKVPVIDMNFSEVKKQQIIPECWK